MSFCAICQSSDGDTTTTLPCGHSFHAACLSKCLFSHIFTSWSDGKGSLIDSDDVPLFRCPLCRNTPHYATYEDAKLPPMTLSELCDVKHYFNQRLFNYIVGLFPFDPDDVYRHLKVNVRDVRNMMMYQCLVADVGFFELGIGR